MAAATERPQGIARVRTLWRLWRAEKTDPAPFYRLLAAEAVEDLDRRYGALAGKTVVDLGCGPGLYTDAFRAAGAHVIPVDNDPAELELAGDPPDGVLIADAGDLPLEDASVDGAFCSNLLEHTPNTPAVIAEIERILKPGGWGYISWTNWYSPWGGHEITPFHYLGPRLGLAAYRSMKGEPRKNVPGEGLFPVHIGSTLALLRRQQRLRLMDAYPRYYPSQRWIVRVPGVREVFTWNCVLLLERVVDAA